MPPVPIACSIRYGPSRVPSLGSVAMPKSQRLSHGGTAYASAVARSNRRDFLIAGGASLLAPGLLARRAQSATAPRIVVVGAGLAGMTAAYRIWKRTGWHPKVYEAHATIGGR